MLHGLPQQQGEYLPVQLANFWMLINQSGEWTVVEDDPRAGSMGLPARIIPQASEPAYRLIKPLGKVSALIEFGPGKTHRDAP